MIRAVVTTAVLAFASSVATADTITVCLDGSCEYSDIQQAINAASDGDVIEIAAGTYYPAATINTIGKAVTLRGVPGKGKDGAPMSVIDGQDSIRVLICESGEGADTVFENLLITGGLAEGGGPDNRGGGIYNYGSSPTLTGCTFAGNSANDAGGGMYNSSSSSPTLTNCTFTGNTASRGGGMYNFYSSPTLENCTFTNNSANSCGGGMCNWESSPTLENCTFEGNSADRGGGMYNWWDSSPTLENCTFTDNSAGSGGGMYNYDSSPSLTGCTFTNNSASRGGGMYTDGDSSPTLTGCTFTGNSATGTYGRGGGMYNYYSSSPTLENCTFEGNTADDNGGGMYNYNNSSPTLTDCTFTGNTASRGGGMLNDYYSSPMLTGTILCGNSPDQIFGGWTDNGGNCLSFSCADDNGDGVPDKCGGKGGAILLVPSEYLTIEAAIAAAAYGDVIEIAAGTYQPTETLNTQGKPITLRGTVDKDGQPAAIIDGQDSIGVLQCSSGEGADTVFENLYITGGSASDGGGMYCYDSNPTLMNCTFEGNSASERGGGMINDYYSSPTLTNCTFSINSADGGGGMYNMNESNPTLTGCLFQGNSAYNHGGGMYNYYSSPTLENCAFTGNEAIYGGGMYNFDISNPLLENCTFEGNSAEYDGGGMYNRYFGSPTLTDTILCGNTPDQVYGAFTDNGGNCLSFSCADDDGDGIPDTCGGKGGGILLVPSVYPTIESAIAAAAYGDVIEIAAGAYQPAETLNTQGKPITLRGAIDGDGNPTTIIDGLDSMRVLQCTSGEGADTVFENLVITGGLAEGSWPHNSGGGMYCDASSPTLMNCTFEGNSATGSYDKGGGGMYNFNKSSPTLTGCTFTGNSADDGGGMFNYGSSPTLMNCTFVDNSATGTYGRGGGMYNWGGSPTLTDCTFAGNSATGTDGRGGGMYNESSSPTLTDCTFTGNSATGTDGRGGGMYNYPSSPTLTDTTVCSNTPDQIIGSWTDKGGNCIQESCDDCDLAECPADFNSDNQVNGQDLGVFLIEWGACTDCTADFNGDGTVDGIDLGLFLVAWGPCP